VSAVQPHLPRPRGLFIPYPLRASIQTLLRNRPNPEIDVIVVTDGERILASVTRAPAPRHFDRKLSLYTVVGGSARADAADRLDVGRTT